MFISRAKADSRFASVFLLVQSAILQARNEGSMFIQISAGNVFLMKYMFFFLCDYSFHDLPMRYVYLCIYDTSCF